MSWSKNTCTYRYMVRINLAEIADAIINSLPGDERIDWEVDDDELLIYMNDRCKAKIWHCPATRWEPEEYDFELSGHVDEVDLKDKIIEGLHKVSDVTYDYEIDYDEIEVDEDDPYDDGDRAYDPWKDRQFEEY